ncbi:MAG: DUF1015 domain-containing protein [Saprospiraceae bacterium]|nr:DUF1015 domain-containing protein [Saprospiraceae bacterium]
MAKIKPFKGIRPPSDLIEKVACLPYDVMNSEEARKMAEGNPYSLLHITKAEIDFPAGFDEHSEEVYSRSRENFIKFQREEVLLQDKDECYYIYGQTMEGRTQYGLVAVANVDDYLNGIIKKHELTRPDKEEDRMINIRYNNANIEPVFFAFPKNPSLDLIMNDTIKNKKADYNFVAGDNIGHHFWVINDVNTINSITEIFEKEIPFTYVADGHHRTAAAARIGIEKRSENPDFTGEEEFNYFLAVHFPDDQLAIMDYNRVVKDLNGLDKQQFLKRIEDKFEIVNKSKDILKPGKLHQFSVYLDGEWYLMNAKNGTFNDNDPIEILDVTVLTNNVLEPILDIQDLRRSKRIDFIGGIRGLGELKKRVDSGEWAVAFALYPVSMKQLIDIADSGNIMPPKTTWFEPKLRSGLVIHSLEG